MPSNVNETVQNFQTLGSNVSIAQRTVDVAVTWTDDNGVQQSSPLTTYTWPNLLTNSKLPAGWLQRKLTQMAIDAIRIIIGLDTDN